MSCGNPHETPCTEVLDQLYAYLDGELGAPDWRGNVPGKPMSPQDVSDVVAWLASQRVKFPGQPYSTSDKSTGEVR